MSRKSLAEYIKVKRIRYAESSRRRKPRIIDEVVETTGFTSKYVINLLNGNIKCRKRKGRGKAYGTSMRKALADIWYEAGCPCTPYFQSSVGMWVSEYEQYVANVGESVRTAILRIERKIPFKITSLNSDNGGEIVNHHLAAHLGRNRPNVYLSRSRPRKCNDNAHVEEKKRSVGRALFGERRFDCPDLEEDLIRLCEDMVGLLQLLQAGQDARPEGEAKGLQGVGVPNSKAIGTGFTPSSSGAG